MDKNDTMDFPALARILKRTGKHCRSSCHGERDISADLRMPGGGVPENDQRQIQAADRLGSAAWSQTLWRNPKRPAAWLGRHRGNRAPRALSRIEGADRDRTDRPQGLRRR